MTMWDPVSSFLGRNFCNKTEASSRFSLKVSSETEVQLFRGAYKGYKALRQGIPHIFEAIISHILFPKDCMQLVFFLQFSTEWSPLKFWWKPLLSDHLKFIKRLGSKVHMAEDLLHFFLPSLGHINFKNN